MCLSELLRLLLKSKIVLPHPEEPFNPLATVENIDIEILRDKCLDDWMVVDRDFWHSIVIIVTDQINNAAETISEFRQVKLQPGWANAGVLAHELAHISYSLLTITGKAQFMVAYDQARNDPLVKLVTSRNINKNPTWRDAPWEIHADVYRFLAHEMPVELKQFYPNLI